MAEAGERGVKRTHAPEKKLRVPRGSECALNVRKEDTSVDAESWHYEPRALG